MTTAASGYTVGDTVAYWLAYGLSGRSRRTVEMYRTYAETHIVPVLGRAASFGVVYEMTTSRSISI
ncbi:MAG TPA: hypothetical protein VF070_24975 [Streptosporangiaceae bacterium]